MLDTIRKGQRWLTAIFIGVIGLVFVFFIGLGGPLTGGPAGGAIVQLDDIRVDVADFQRVRSQSEQRVRDALGDQFDAKQASDFLDTQTLRSLIDIAVLADAARELGYRVSKREIQSILKANPQFLDSNGRFDREAFREWADWNYGSQRAFLNSIRPDLLRRKLIRLVVNHTHVSEGEARSAALYRMQEIRVAFVAFDTETLPAGQTVSDEEVARRVADREVELTALYDERKDSYQQPEQVRARHILFRVPENAVPDDVAAIRTRAEEALNRIRGGADMGDVALELSEDPGSRAQRGDLGFFARGEASEALDKAAFDLEPGVLSDLVRSDAGFHIVRVEERREAGSRSFDDVREELSRELAETQVAREYSEQLAESLSEAVAGGKSLETAARDRSLTLERTIMLRRRPDGFIPGLGASPEALDVAFSLDLEQPSPARIFHVGSKRALIQLLERREPDAESLARAVAEERERLVGRKENDRLQAWVDVHRKALVDSGRLLVDASIVTGG